MLFHSTHDATHLPGVLQPWKEHASSRSGLSKVWVLNSSPGRAHSSCRVGHVPWRLPTISLSLSTVQHTVSKQGAWILASELRPRKDVRCCWRALAADTALSQLAGSAEGTLEAAGLNRTALAASATRYSCRNRRLHSFLLASSSSGLRSPPHSLDVAVTSGGVRQLKENPKSSRSMASCSASDWLVCVCHAATIASDGRRPCMCGACKGARQARCSCVACWACWAGVSCISQLLSCSSCRLKLLVRASWSEVPNPSSKLAPCAMVGVFDSLIGWSLPGRLLAASCACRCAASNEAASEHQAYH